MITLKLILSYKQIFITRSRSRLLSNVYWLYYTGNMHHYNLCYSIVKYLILGILQTIVNINIRVGTYLT